MRSNILLTSYLVAIVSGKTMPYYSSEQKNCPGYVPIYSPSTVVSTPLPSSYLPSSSALEDSISEESIESEDLEPVDIDEPIETSTLSLPNSNVTEPESSTSSNVEPTPEPIDDGSSAFQKLVGNYFDLNLQSTPQPKCSPISNILLNAKGIIVRSYCLSENSTDTKYTFGTWGTSQGKLVERLNVEEKDLSFNSTLSIAPTIGGINLNGTSLVKRNDTRSLDSILNIFGNFQSKNCTQSFISSLSLSPTGKYSIAKCPTNQPLSIENGLFTIDTVSAHNNIELVLHPDQSFMHPAKLQVLDKDKLVFDGALLFKSSDR